MSPPDAESRPAARRGGTTGRAEPASAVADPSGTPDARPARPELDHGYGAPDEGFREALSRARHWLAAPPAEAPPETAAAPAPIEQRTTVSIGTIHVTVEEPEGGPERASARPAAAPPPSRPRAVPRHYLRGW